MKWSVEKTSQLKSLIKLNKFTYPEIAKQMGLNNNQVRTKGDALGIKNRVFKEQRQCKHKHLRAKAMRFFLNHSFEETSRKFNLTASETKSLMTVSYKDPRLAGLRKDHRRKDVWSLSETLFFVRRAGLLDRTTIARKLNRGTDESVKEAIFRMKTNSRWLNGLSQKYSNMLLGERVPGLKTKAGPTSPGADFRYICVPWVVLYTEASRIEGFSPQILSCLRAMARFQRFIHGTRGVNDTVKKLKQYLEEES